MRQQRHLARRLARKNHRLAQAISDAGWAEFARLLGYKQAWRGGHLAVADRWFPSSKLCRACGTICGDLTLADRVFTSGCGHSADRDLNAAVNLARWAEGHHDLHLDPRTPKHGGRATNARARDGTDQHLRVLVKPARMTREPTFTPRQRPEPTAPENGGAGTPSRVVRHALDGADLRGLRLRLLVGLRVQLLGLGFPLSGALQEPDKVRDRQRLAAAGRVDARGQ
jgi:Putative transposase DNA-binding domain